MSMRSIIYEGCSPNEVWLLKIGGPTQDLSCFYATFKRLGQGLQMGFPFGYDAEPSSISVRWDLPDDVCGIFINDKCFALFRYGPRRRRKREYYRTGMKLFSKSEIAWICAKKHTQRRWNKSTDDREL